MSFIVLFLINIVYVVVEFAFNFHLLNITSGSASLSEIHNLELIGRTLASFGGTFLFWKIISSVSIKHKMIVLIMGTLIIYPTIYFSQKEVIEHLSSNSSVESRTRNANLYLLKKGLQNNSLEIKGFPTSDQIENNTEAKVFISTLGLMTLGNDTLVDYIKNNRINISNQVFKGDINNDASIEEHYNNFLKTLAKKDEIWGEYNSSKSVIDTQYSRAQDEANNAYSKIQNNGSSAYSEYKNNYVSKFNDGVRFSKKYSDDIVSGLRKVAGCNNNDACIRERNIKFMDWQKTQLARIKLTTADAPIISFTENCTPKAQRGNYSCEYEANKYERLLVNRLERKFTELSGFDSPYYSNEAQFLNSGGYTSYVNTYIAKNYGLKMGDNWTVSNKSSFVKSFSDAYESKIISESASTLKSKYGVSLPMNLNKSEFFNNNEVNKLFAKNFGAYYYNTSKTQVTKDEFLKSVYPVISSKLANQYSSKDFANEDGINMVKAMIIPPVALLFSLFFGVINLIVLIKSLIHIVLKFVVPNFNYKTLVLKVFTFVSVGFIIVIPFVFDNAYTSSESYSKMIGSLDSYNSVLALSVDWLFRFEPFVYNIGSFLSPVVHLIQSINLA